MANYALTVTPKFTPFTYDELIKPIETYQKVYDTYDATYEKAAEDAAKFASLDAEKDPIAYQRYQNYLQNIQKQRDALYKSGLSSSTRRGFQDLRSTYSTEIKPMEIAYDKKLEDIKNYDKLMMTNPQMRAVRNPHETSLDEYMTNDELGNRYIDLNMVEKSAADIFSKAREKVIQYGHLDAETRDIITRVGLTPGEILAALDDAAKGGNTNAAKTINRITDEVRNQFGYDEIDNASIRNDIDATITRAAWNLRGDETHQYVTDAGAKRYLDYQDWKKKEDYKQEQELEKIKAQKEAEEEALRYTTGLEPSSVKTSPKTKSVLTTNFENLADYDYENPSKVFGSPQKVMDFHEGFKYLTKEDKEKAENLLSRLTSVGINDTFEGFNSLGARDAKKFDEILRPYGMMLDPSDDLIKPIADYVATSYDPYARQLKQKRDSYLNNKALYEQNVNSLYRNYTNKYANIYTGSTMQEKAEAIKKYELLENAKTAEQVYETSIHSGYLDEGTGEKLGNAILRDLTGSSVIYKVDEEGNRTKVDKPQAGTIDNVKLDTDGHIYLIDKDDNRYDVTQSLKKLETTISPIVTVANGFNLEVANNKKILQNISDFNSVQQIPTEYKEYIGDGYTKIVAKVNDENNTPHLETLLIKNNKIVATLTDEDVLNGGEAKMVYLGNLTDNIGGDIQKMWTTKKPTLTTKNW